GCFQGTEGAQAVGALLRHRGRIAAVVRHKDLSATPDFIGRRGRKEPPPHHHESPPKGSRCAGKIIGQCFASTSLRWERRFDFFQKQFNSVAGGEPLKGGRTARDVRRLTQKWSGTTTVSCGGGTGAT